MNGLAAQAGALLFGAIVSLSGTSVHPGALTTGIITTVVGNGTAGYNSDGIAATAAQLNYPAGVTIDSSGRLYIAAPGNERIRRVP